MGILESHAVMPPSESEIWHVGSKIRAIRTGWSHAGNDRPTVRVLPQTVDIGSAVSHANHRQDRVDGKNEIRQQQRVGLRVIGHRFGVLDFGYGVMVYGFRGG